MNGVLVFDESSVREITGFSWRYRFQEALYSKCLPPTRKSRAGVFKFSRFEERFRDRSVWTIDQTVEIILRFQFYSAECWQGLNRGLISRKIVARYTVYINFIIYPDVLKSHKLTLFSESVSTQLAQQYSTKYIWHFNKVIFV